MGDSDNETLLEDSTSAETGNTVKIMLQYLQHEQASTKANTAPQGVISNVTLPVPQYKETFGGASKKLGALFDYLDNSGKNGNFKNFPSERLPVPQDSEHRNNLSSENVIPTLKKRPRLDSGAVQNSIRIYPLTQQNVGNVKSENPVGVNKNKNTAMLSPPKAVVSGFAVRNLSNTYNPLLQSGNGGAVETQGSASYEQNKLAFKSVAHLPISNGAGIGKIASQSPVVFSSDTVNVQKLSKSQPSIPQMTPLSTTNNNLGVNKKLITTDQFKSSQNSNLPQQSTINLSQYNSQNQQAAIIGDGSTRNTPSIVQTQPQKGLIAIGIVTLPKHETKVSPYVNPEMPHKVHENNIERWASLLQDVDKALGASTSSLNMHPLSKTGKARLLGQKAAVLEKISNALDVVSSKIDALEGEENKSSLKKFRNKKERNKEAQQGHFGAKNNGKDPSGLNKNELSSLQNQVNAAIIAAENSNSHKLSQTPKLVNAFVPYLSANTNDVSPKSRANIQDRESKMRRVKLMRKFQDLINKFIDQQEKTGKMNEAKLMTGKSNGTLFTQLAKDVARKFGDVYDVSFGTGKADHHKDNVQGKKLTVLNDVGSRTTSAVQPKLTDKFLKAFPVTSKPLRKQTLNSASTVKGVAPQHQTLNLSIPAPKKITVRVSTEQTKGNMTANIVQQLRGLANQTGIKERGALANVIENLVKIVGGRREGGNKYFVNKTAQRMPLLRPQSTFLPLNGGLVGGTINNEIDHSPQILDETIGSVIKGVNKAPYFPHAESSSQNLKSEPQLPKLVNAVNLPKTLNAVTMQPIKSNPTVSISGLRPIGGVDTSPNSRSYQPQKVKGLKSSDYEEIPTDKPSKAVMSQKGEPGTEDDYKYNSPAIAQKGSPAHAKATITSATMSKPPQALPSTKLALSNSTILSIPLSKVLSSSKTLSSLFSTLSSKFSARHSTKSESSPSSSYTATSFSSKISPTKNPRPHVLAKPTITEGLVINLPNDLLEDVTKYLEISPDRKYLQLKSGNPGDKNLLIALPSSKLRSKGKNTGHNKAATNEMSSFQGNRLMIRLPSRAQLKGNNEPAIVQLQKAGTNPGVAKVLNGERSSPLVALPFDEKKGESRNLAKAEGKISKSPLLKTSPRIISIGSGVTMGKINSSYEAALNIKPPSISVSPSSGQEELQGKLTAPVENKNDNDGDMSYTSASSVPSATVLSSQLPGFNSNSTENISLPSVLHLGSDTDSGTKGLRLLLISNDDDKQLQNTSQPATKQEQVDNQNSNDADKGNKEPVDSILQQVMSGLETQLTKDKKIKNVNMKTLNHTISKEGHSETTLKPLPSFEVTGDPFEQPIRGEHLANGGNTSNGLGYKPEENAQTYGQYTSYNLPKNPYEVSAYSTNENPYSDGFIDNVPNDETGIKTMMSSEILGVPNDKYSYSEDLSMNPYPQLSKQISVPDDPVMNALKNIEKEQDNLEAAKLKAIQKHSGIVGNKSQIQNETARDNVVKLNNIAHRNEQTLNWNRTNIELADHNEVSKTKKVEKTKFNLKLLATNEKQKKIPNIKSLRTSHNRHRSLHVSIHEGKQFALNSTELTTKSKQLEARAKGGIRKQKLLNSDNNLQKEGSGKKASYRKTLKNTAATPGLNPQFGLYNRTSNSSQTKKAPQFVTTGIPKEIGKTDFEVKIASKLKNNNTSFLQKQKFKKQYTLISQTNKFVHSPKPEPKPEGKEKVFYHHNHKGVAPVGQKIIKTQEASAMNEYRNKRRKSPKTRESRIGAFSRQEARVMHSSKSAKRIETLETKLGSLRRSDIAQIPSLTKR